MKTISIDDDVYAHIASRTADIGESASQVLRREMNMGSQLKIVFLEEDVYHYLISKIVNIGESASTILRRELALSSPPPVPPPSGSQLIEFHIARGTGSGPWNTSETRVIANVGDTLRIWNDDDVPHEVHTDGSPFQHAQFAMPPGSSTDFVLQSVFQPSTGHTLHDHLNGPNAIFWIEVKAA
jgi:SeqA protein N-terminal domain